MKTKFRYKKTDDESYKNIVFNMMNENTVERMRKQRKMNVPYVDLINIPKDRRWNQKFITSQFYQAMMNGESIDDIANRLFEEIDKKSLKGRTPEQRRSIEERNRQSSIRNARTMTTNAECGGRLDSYRELDSQGVVQKKVWVATPDDRTRPSHIDMDGEEQNIDDAFSNGCQFPGDGNGPAEEVWCCRCTMRDHIVGFRRADGTISRVNYQRDETLHDRQMREELERRREDG